MIIAVDGPSGAGKGTLAKRLAKRYDLAFLDTGLLYRAVAAQMLAFSMDLNDAKSAAKIAEKISLENMNEELLRSELVSQGSSIIAVFPEVRIALLEFQRSFAQYPPFPQRGVVLDGRDIGTQICPNANIKFYVTADVKIRAERRCKELQDRGIKSIYSEVLNEMIQRDQRDQQRSESPLQIASDAIVIDTTHSSADEAFKFAARRIEAFLISDRQLG